MMNLLGTPCPHCILDSNLCVYLYVVIILLCIGCDFVFHGFFCQDVQLENYLLMKQDTPLEEA